MACVNVVQIAVIHYNQWSYYSKVIRFNAINEDWTLCGRAVLKTFIGFSGSSFLLLQTLTLCSVGHVHFPSVFEKKIIYRAH